MKNTILIIDQECNNYHFLKERLEQQRYVVHTSADYDEGIHSIFKLKPDLIIYHFHLFLLSEKEFKEELTRHIPIMIVSPSHKEEDLLYAFEMGAADYITKPFHIREVEARVKAILRRIEITRSAEMEEIKIGEFVLHSKENIIDLKTHKVNLSNRELQVLLLLKDHKKLSREEMIRYIWGFDYYGGCRILDVNISNLRRKIEKDPKKPQLIKTIKGFGYRLEEPIMKEG